MLEFICAVYNEETEIYDLVNHIGPFVDRMTYVSDGSTDQTLAALYQLKNTSPWDIQIKSITHTGLCEIARMYALEMCAEDSWVLMCDADERFTNLPDIEKWVDSVDAEGFDYVTFDQLEYVDGIHTRGFQKVKLYRKLAVQLSPIIHQDPSFTGNGASFGWEVIHRKSSEKQVLREKEYLETYDRLEEQGLITSGQKAYFRSLHYFEKGDNNG